MLRFSLAILCGYALLGCTGSKAVLAPTTDRDVVIETTTPALTDPQLRSQHLVILDGTATFAEWPAAEGFERLDATPNRDSVVIALPEVIGAKDYRVFALDEGMRLRVSAAEGEGLVGATVYCAGNAQSPRPAQEIAVRPARQVEVFGVGGPTDLVVEAIDELCPYVGTIDTQDSTYPLASSSQSLGSAKSIPFRTEESVRSVYGSYYINGHRRGVKIGDPATNGGQPRVLARALVRVSPLGYTETGMQHFDDFSDPSDVFRQAAPMTADGIASLQNTKWNFYHFSNSTLLASPALLRRGQLSMTLADPGQEPFTYAALTSKAPTVLSDDAYLHITFESHTLSTDRRYLFAAVCGTAKAGDSFKPSGLLSSPPVFTSDFSHATTGRPVMFDAAKNWSCIQAVENEGSFTDISSMGRPIYASVRTVLNRPAPLDQAAFAIGPTQKRDDDSPVWRTWYAAAGPNGAAANKPVIEDEVGVATRTRHDLYVSRKQMVLYINGEQRLCTKLSAAHRLTMQDPAVIIGQVLYHTSAEQQEEPVKKSAMRFMREASAWVETRSWDNVGYHPGAELPDGFAADRCFNENYPD